jgi:hypothetical protein
MADNDFRSFRSREPATQNSAQGGARDRGYGAQTPPRGPLDDPLAELARLIGQREPAHNPDRGTRHHSSPPLTDAPPAQEWVDDRYAGASDQGHYAEQTQHDDQYQERSHDERSHNEHSIDDRQYNQRQYGDRRYGDQYDAPQLGDPRPPYRAAPPSYDAGYEEPDQYAAPTSRYTDRPRYADERADDVLPAFLPNVRDQHRDARYDYPPEQLGDPDEESYTLEDYQEEPPRKRRTGLAAIGAVLGLAVLGTAGAFAYRAMFGGALLPSLPPIIRADNGPTKIMPAGSSQNNSSTHADAGGSSERLVSREEKPLDVPTPVNAPRVVSTIPIYPDPNSGLQASVTPGSPGMAQGIPGAAPPGLSANVTGGSAALGPTAAGSVNALPVAPPPVAAGAPSANDQSLAGQASTMPASSTKKIHTVAIHADPSADPNAASQAPVARPAAPRPVASAAAQSGSNAPLSIVPGSTGPTPAPAAARTHTAAAHSPETEPAASASGAGGYAVQVSSQKSEDEAQSAFSALQAKFPNQLGGRTPIIRRADLGAKGIYYRTLVGPFATMEQAASLCSSLKAAGGSCLVQKN